jgi:hypothetical protein
MAAKPSTAFTDAAPTRSRRATSRACRRSALNTGRPGEGDLVDAGPAEGGAGLAPPDHDLQHRPFRQQFGPALSQPSTDPGGELARLEHHRVAGRQGIGDRAAANRYDGRQLHDETAASPFWYYRGINWCGVSAQVLGSTVALLAVNTTLVVGPIAHVLGGADLSAMLGPIVAAGVYAGLTVQRRRSQSFGPALIEAD